jgi:hypothetical protein
MILTILTPDSWLLTPPQLICFNDTTHLRGQTKPIDRPNTT